MDLTQIKDLIKQLEESKLSKLVVKKGDFELHLEKEATHFMPPKARPVPVETESVFEPEVPSKSTHAKSQPGAYVTSPMVGTYYASPAPDQPAFVKVGDTVNEHTVVCIIEAMKVMNEVKAGVKGTVAEILADNSQPVEFGTKLLRIT